MQGQLLRQVHSLPRERQPGPRFTWAEAENCKNTCGKNRRREAVLAPGCPRLQGTWIPWSTAEAKTMQTRDQNSAPLPCSVTHVCPECAWDAGHHHLFVRSFKRTQEKCHWCERLSAGCSPGGWATFWGQTAPCIFKARSAWVTLSKQGATEQAAQGLHQSQPLGVLPQAWEREAGLVPIMSITLGPPKTMPVSKERGSLVERKTVQPGVRRVLKPKLVTAALPSTLALDLGLSETKPLALAATEMAPLCLTWGIFS